MISAANPFVILPETAQLTDVSKRHNVNWGKIKNDIEKVRHLMDFEVDPRKILHLDTTKIAYHKERVEAWERGEKIAPVTIDMALTQKCNFACTYCYAGLQYNPASPTNWKTYENLLDDFVEIGHKLGEGVKAVSLVSDGESTANPYYYDFIHKGKENGLDMASGTNGTLLKKEKLPQLLEDLTYIRFNISAGEPAPYAKVMGTTEKMYWHFLDIAKECVKIKQENGLAVTIGFQMVLLPEYADQVIPLALLGKDIGVDYTIFKHCSDDENGRLGVDYAWYKTPEAIELLKAAEALSTDDYSVQAKWSKMRTGRDRKYSKCYGPPLFLQISGSCVVAPCGSLFHTDYKDFHIGNFAKQRFKDIWASDKYWQVLGHLASDKFDPRYRCATLCLQDKVNEVLFDLKEKGIQLEDVSGKSKPMHGNFI